MTYSRASILKLSFFVATLALIALFVAISHASGWNAWTMFLVLVCLLAPGRVQGILLRDLFRGRLALARGNPSEALRCFDRMLDRLARHPRLAWSILLSWPIYTLSLRAMTLNDLGAAHQDMKNEGAAAEAWRKALELDPDYAIPCLNLATREIAAGRHQAAARLLRRARKAGYSGSALDRLAQRGQSALARIEGDRGS